VTVPLTRTTAKLEIPHQGCACGFPSGAVGGMDVMTAGPALAKAAGRVCRGSGLSPVECKTYCWYGSTRSSARLPDGGKRDGTEGTRSDPSLRLTRGQIRGGHEGRR
jgi:TPP-dependent pyruvate/acetoin dehydrogenase alpha subunit